MARQARAIASTAYGQDGQGACTYRPRHGFGTRSGGALDASAATAAQRPTVGCSHASCAHARSRETLQACQVQLSTASLPHSAASAASIQSRRRLVDTTLLNFLGIH